MSTRNRPSRLPTRPVELDREPSSQLNSTLSRYITSLNRDYNLDIRPNDVVYQALQPLDNARLGSTRQSFHLTASIISENWKRKGQPPNESFPRAQTQRETDDLRSSLLRCIKVPPASTAGTHRANGRVTQSFPMVTKAPYHLPPKAGSFSLNHPVPSASINGVREPPHGSMLPPRLYSYSSASENSSDSHSSRKKRQSTDAAPDPLPEKRQCMPFDRYPPGSPTQPNTPVEERPPASSDLSVSSDKDMVEALWESIERIGTCDGTRDDEETEDASYVTCPEPDLESKKPTDIRVKVVSAQVESRLKNIWPCLPNCMKKLKFPVAWEVARVAMSCGISLTPDTIIEVDPDWGDMTYACFWNSLRKHSRFKDEKFPEKSSGGAWEAALRGTHKSSQQMFRSSQDNGVQFSANAEFALPQKGEQPPLFTVKLNPIRLELTHRLGRQFGPDKFLEVLFPTFERNNIPLSLRSNADIVVERITHWMAWEPHFLLGQRFSFFFIKDVRHKTNFKRNELGRLMGEIEIQRRYYMLREFSRHHVVNWLLQLRSNAGNHAQPCLKLFSRLTLGLSRTNPTIVVAEDQIRHRDEDVLSEKGPDGRQKVMNDGCARMSQGMAQKIYAHLGMDDSPCAFQARFGSAKGMWIVDIGLDKDEFDPEDIWIETYPSQRKWECDFSDENQRTFEVRNYCPSTIQPASVNTQLLPVLEHGAVDKAAMREYLGRVVEQSINDELAKQEVALQTPTQCALWVNQFRRSAESRQDPGAESFGSCIGGFPNANSDQITFLVAHGYHPQKQKYVQDLTKQLRDDEYNRMTRKLNFQIGRSAYFFMLADMWGLLKEDEVHVCFSESFQDKSSGFKDIMLNGCDVLVARSPAHFPSDVQRVKAVFYHQLRKLTNVIIFSTKGREPLADKLSGGDYDGDQAWVCWDQNIVKNFNNNPVPDCPPELALDKINTSYRDLLKQEKMLHTDAITAMVQQGFRFNCEGSLLGKMTSYKEKFCYNMETIANKEAILLSHLLSQLVDQAKQGTIFNMEVWDALRKSQGLPGSQDFEHEPAYKSEQIIEWRKNWRPPKHISDILKFVVCKKAVDAGKVRFDLLLDRTQASYGDTDVTAWNDRLERDFPQIHQQIRKDLYALRGRWNKASSARGPQWRINVVALHQEYVGILPLGTQDEERRIGLLADHDMPGCISNWSLFKAAVLFKISWSSQLGGQKFIWHMAGRELGIIKAMACGHSVTITGDYHSALKIDKRVVARELERIVRAGIEDVDV